MPSKASTKTPKTTSSAAKKAGGSKRSPAQRGSAQRGPAQRGPAQRGSAQRGSEDSSAGNGAAGNGAGGNGAGGGSSASPTSSPTRRPARSRATAKNGAKKAGAKAEAGRAEAGRASTSRASTGKAGAARTRRSRNGASGRAGSQRKQAAARAAMAVPRAMPVVDDDDVLMALGAGGGAGFGRCGGRMLGSKLEQVICDRLSNAGVAHSHSPRHFEVTVREKQVAAYAPMVVLRGRGREGKSVVLEASDDPEAAILRKVLAFRQQYGQEYYIILIAPEDTLDEVALATYDEACAETDLNTLIARLAE